MVNAQRLFLFATALGLFAVVGTAQGRTQHSGQKVARSKQTVSDSARALVRRELVAKASKLVRKGEVAAAHGEYVRAEQLFGSAEALLARAQGKPGSGKGRVIALDDVTNGDDAARGVKGNGTVVLLDDVTNGEQKVFKKGSWRRAEVGRISEGVSRAGKDHGKGHDAREHDRGHGKGEAKNSPPAGAHRAVFRWVEDAQGDVRPGVLYRFETEADKDSMRARVTRLEREIEALGDAVRAFQRGMEAQKPQRIRRPVIEVRDASGTRPIRRLPAPRRIRLQQAGRVDSKRRRKRRII